MLLSCAPTLGGSLGSECSVAEDVVVRSLSRLCCRWPKGILRLLVHALVVLLPHLLVNGKGFVQIVRCHLHVFRLASLFLCLKCIASASARMRFAWIVASCSSDSLCVCEAAVRCLPRGVPSCFCHPVRPSAPREKSRTSACACSRLCSSVFRHFTTWLRWLLGSSRFCCQCFYSVLSFKAKSSPGRESDGVSL